jgi:hypothetical protein
MTDAERMKRIKELEDKIAAAEESKEKYPKDKITYDGIIKKHRKEIEKLKAEKTESQKATEEAEKERAKIDEDPELYRLKTLEKVYDDGYNAAYKAGDSKKKNENLFKRDGIRAKIAEYTGVKVLPGVSRPEFGGYVPPSSTHPIYDPKDDPKNAPQDTPKGDTPKQDVPKEVIPKEVIPAKSQSLPHVPFDPYAMLFGRLKDNIPKGKINERLNDRSHVDTLALSRMVDKLNNKMYYRPGTKGYYYSGNGGIGETGERGSLYSRNPIDTEDARQQKADQALSAEDRKREIDRSQNIKDTDFELTKEEMQIVMKDLNLPMEKQRIVWENFQDDPTLGGLVANAFGMVPPTVLQQVTNNFLRKLYDDSGGDVGTAAKLIVNRLGPVLDDLLLKYLPSIMETIGKSAGMSVTSVVKGVLGLDDIPEPTSQTTRKN